MVKVAKFGGSSLANAENIKKAADIVRSDAEIKYVVVSAPGEDADYPQKITDMLYSAYLENNTEAVSEVKKRFEDISKELDVAINVDIFHMKNKFFGLDYYLSRGEYIMALIFAEYLGYKFVDASDIIFFKQNGELDSKKTLQAVKSKLEKCPYAVIPGFYGSFDDGTVKTFLRGGSDITGALIAQAVDCDMYENWTDVDGFMMADPKRTGEVNTISRVSYSQIKALSGLGANIIHPQAVYPAFSSGIPVNIRNTFNPRGQGTFIVNSEIPCPCITGVTGEGGYSMFVIDKEKCDFALNQVFAKNGVQTALEQKSGGNVVVAVKSAFIKDMRRKLLSELCTDEGFVYIIDGMALLLITAKCIKNDYGVLCRVLKQMDDNQIACKLMAVDGVFVNVTMAIEQEYLEKGIKVIYNTLKKENFC